MDSRPGLPPRTILDGGYRIAGVVGSGGFGITYEAEDTNLGTKVAIKEYYPFDFGDRASTLSVRPKSDRHKQTFERGLANFLREARTLARFEHPHIVRVTRVFEANSTAYMVMRLEQGQSLEAWLNGLNRLPTQEELDRIAGALLDALEVMHDGNFLHRDIAPDNILVRPDGSPVLIDFGAARHAFAEMSRSLTGIVKAGYSPHEQYSSDTRQQGPWTDLYAFGGTLYRAVMGRPPEEATLRLDDDRMLPAARAAKGQYRAGFLAGIDACLKVRHADRPKSVAVLRPTLLGGDRPGFPSLVQALRPASGRRPPTSGGRVASPLRPGSWRAWAAMAVAVAAVLAGAFGGYRYLQPADPKSAEAAGKEAARRQAAQDAEKASRSRQAEIDAERTLVAEKVFKDCAACPEMTVIPNGEFMMGSSRADIDAGAAANEGPQRQVVIKRQLAVGRFEVTRDQFEAFVQASSYKFGDRCWTLEGNEPRERDGRTFRNPGYAQTGTHPAVCVSWMDAKAYVAWLSHATRKEYRLLSEAEWEYAARAGTSTRYASGSSEAQLCAVANGADQTAKSASLPRSWSYLGCTDGHVHTAPVGSFRANGFGVFDLTGNVWEWVEDCYAGSLENTPGDGVARSAGDCPMRTVRGGSWSAGAQVLRLPVRAPARGDARYDDIGFRVARALVLQP